jgi:hypothetical protein
MTLFAGDHFCGVGELELDEGEIESSADLHISQVGTGSPQYSKYPVSFGDDRGDVLFSRECSGRHDPEIFFTKNSVCSPRVYWWMIVFPSSSE